MKIGKNVWLKMQWTNIVLNTQTILYQMMTMKLQEIRIEVGEMQ